MKTPNIVIPQGVSPEESALLLAISAKARLVWAGLVRGQAPSPVQERSSAGFSTQFLTGVAKQSFNEFLNRNQSAPDTDCYRLRSRTRAQFGQNGADVKLHRVLGDREPRRNFFVTEALGHHAQHLALSRSHLFGGFIGCLRFVAINRRQLLSRLRRQKHVPAIHGINRGDNLLPVAISRQNGTDARLQKARRGAGVGMLRE